MSRERSVWPVARLTDGSGSRSALDYLFETLKKHGDAYPPEFWDTVCKEVLFPIFAVLRSRHDVSRFSTHEDMSVWLSTTMIQALRNLVDLFTFYFDVLARMLDKLLDLLCECICQGERSENPSSSSGLKRDAHRKRHPGSYRNGLLAAAVGEQCREALARAVGTNRFDVHPIIQNDDSLPALRPESVAS